MKMLLGRKAVSPNKQDNEGQTPLMAAATRGRDGVVKILLGRQDVTPGTPDDRGHTPLMSAYAKGHKRVIELLEPLEAVNPKRKCEFPILACI